MLTGANQVAEIKLKKMVEMAEDDGSADQGRRESMVTPTGPRRGYLGRGTGIPKFSR